MKIKKKIENIDINNFIEQYLKICGIKDVEGYLNPNVSFYDDPFDYVNIEKAIEIFNKHVNKKDLVGIVMDSDMDGACSAAIIDMFCHQMGMDTKIYFHSGKQHGLHDKIEEIIKDRLSFIIIPDAGTNDIEDCKLIKKNNKECDILILDHHEVLYENPYAVVINNQLGNVNKALSGAGVTYKFVEAYSHFKGIVPNQYEDIVAISIVSDICDLTSLENRTFLYYGFKYPKNLFLINLFDTVCKYRGVCPEAIGWDISPLANALARMDEQEYKTFFFECLTGRRNDYENSIKEMKRIKRKQDTLVKQITNEIESNLNLDHKVIIGFTEPENKEIIGLIANKFTGKYRKPTILLREMNSTAWTGSLRSPIDLLEVINKSKLAQCMGHGAACGITVKKANLNKLAKFLDNLDIEIDPEYEVAGELTLKDITLNLAQEIIDNKILWGKNIEKPQFYISLDNPNVDIFKKSTTTIKLTKDGISFIKFFCSEEMIDQFQNLNNKVVNLIFEIDVNVYNGVMSPQCNIVEYEIEEKNNILKNEEEFDWDSIFQ